MTSMRFSRWLAALTLVIALASSAASVLEADTLSINGTFHMDQLSGTVGADLAEVFAHQNEHTWSLKLYGITYSHDEYYVEWNDEGGYGYIEEFYTFAHATSFDFQFFGPDAIVLNEVVSQQLIGGEASLSLLNENSFDSLDFFGGGRKASWSLGLRPLDLGGVSFSAASWSLFYPFLPNYLSTDENGYPVLAPQSLYGDTYIHDDRSGSSAYLESYYDYVEIEALILSLPGDFNDDSVVDGSDFLKWQRGESPIFGSPAELSNWENYYGTVGPSPLSDAAAVPEPASLVLTILAFASRMAKRRHLLRRKNV